MHQCDYSELRERYLAGDKTAATWRQEAKSETFKPLYGGSRGTAAQERWYKAFRERYPDLAQTQKDWVAAVIGTKRLVTPWGLRFYWPRAKISQGGYVNCTASVYNFPIQSLATADIVPIAMRYFWSRAEHLQDKLFLVNTVHDSVVMEIHPDAVDEAKTLLERAFTTDVYEYLKTVYGLNFDVPLNCDIKVGRHWGEDDGFPESPGTQASR